MLRTACAAAGPACRRARRHSNPGLHAKLQLAAFASRRGDARIYVYEDREWLNAILHDVPRVMAPVSHQTP